MNERLSVEVGARGELDVERRGVVELDAAVGGHAEEGLLHLLDDVLPIGNLELLFVGSLLRLVPELLGASLEVLLALRLALEHLVDALLLVGLHNSEALAELEERRGALLVSDGDETAGVLDVERRERNLLGDLHAQRGVVLLVVVVPHVERRPSSS